MFFPQDFDYFLGTDNMVPTCLYINPISTFCSLVYVGMWLTFSSTQGALLSQRSLMACSVDCMGFHVSILMACMLGKHLSQCSISPASSPKVFFRMTDRESSLASHCKDDISFESRGHCKIGFFWHPSKALCEEEGSHLFWPNSLYYEIWIS